MALYFESQLTKMHSFRLFIWRFCPLGKTFYWCFIGVFLLLRLLGYL